MSASPEAPAEVILADWQAAHARYISAVQRIQARATSKADAPPEWIATAADLPGFFQWLEKCGKIAKPPELFTPDLLRSWFVRLLDAQPGKTNPSNGRTDPKCFAYAVPASRIREMLTASGLLSDAEKALLPKPHAFGSVLRELAEEPEQRRIVCAFVSGKFSVEENNHQTKGTL